LRWVLVLGAGAVVVAIGLMLGAEAPEALPQATAPARVSGPQARPSGELALPSREGLNRPRGNPFASSAPPPSPAAKQQPASAPAEPLAPVAPPVPYRVAGQVVHEGPPHVVLARDDRVYMVREGDVLEGGYRVESIGSDGVTLVYTPLDQRQHLAAASSLQVPGAAAPQAADTKQLQPAGGSQPAQLRWEGPARVQAGSEFEVALKITSDQPVRGSPLQLSYDAKLLEAVSVRAGDFFVDGSFTYRVNPAGSIFVGAFGKGEVPADAEFLVVTFRPIRAGTTAELKLSSMVLQGLGGSAVGHAPLAAFRTSITQ
jgi:cohesin domain-containing protein